MFNARVKCLKGSDDSVRTGKFYFDDGFSQRQSFAHPEYAEKMKMLKQQLSFIHRYENFIGKLDKTISYSVFHFKSMQRPEKKAAMVISPGHTEPSIKYLEVAYDFMKLGYYPIYVIDHRGQGRSQGLMFSDPSNPATRRDMQMTLFIFKKIFDNLLILLNR